MLSWLPQAWKFLRWLVGAEQAVEPVVKELAPAVKELVREVADPEPPGVPLPFREVEHQRAQIDAATSHKVAPPSSPAPTPKPHPRDP